MRRRVALVLAAAAAMATLPAPPSGAALNAVSIQDNFFSPRRLEIAQGTKVKWTNNGSIKHTTTSNTGLWDKKVGPGKSKTVQFLDTGVFKYHCNIHDEMKGKIIVADV